MKGHRMKNAIKTVFAAVAMTALWGQGAVTKPEPPKRDVWWGTPAYTNAVKWTVPKTFSGTGGKKLNYRWAEPERTEPGRKYPLVVLFHGAGERGADNVRQLVWGAGDLLGYMREKNIPGYFIAGQVPTGQLWVNTPWALAAHRMPAEPGETMALVLELVEKCAAELPVDRDRIYVTGVSMGGYGTWDAVQRRPDLFAAAMPVCGGGDTHLAWRIRDVPIWTWHGDRDGAVPVTRSREMTSALWAVDGNIRYTEVPGCGHDVWRPAYASREALDWFFSRRKGSVRR